METRRIKIRELAAWTPAMGGAISSAQDFPTSTSAPTILAVFPPIGERLTFRVAFEGIQFSYHFKASSEKIASQIYDRALSCQGRKVAELEELDVEVEERSLELSS